MNPEALTSSQNLDGLREIALPAAVSYVPQTWGWLALGIFVLMVAGWAAWRWRKHYRAQAWRREALRELDGIAVTLDGSGRNADALAALPALVKRVALATAARPEVAGLSSTDWLTWLDKTGGTEAFVTGPGKLLPVLAYARREITTEEARALIGLVRDWIGERHADP